MSSSKDFYTKYIDMPVEEGLIFRREGNQIATNMPHLVVQHSLAGYEWGYEGSGPADLALNICELVLRKMGYQGEKIRDFRDNEFFHMAWKLHQDFKRDFIAGLDREGGEILWSEVVAWVNARI